MSEPIKEKTKNILKVFLAMVLIFSIVSCENKTKLVPVDGVTLSVETITLVLGDQYAFKAIISPENATNPEVKWSSSDTEIVDIDSDGVVTTIAGGEAIITVSTVDNRSAAHCNVRVVIDPIPVTGISLDQTSLTLEVGTSETLIATIEPEDATNQNIIWSSSDEDVAIVSEDGVVTAIMDGEAIITVTTEDGEFTATCEVIVSIATIPVTGISLDQTSLTLEAGASETLIATIVPEDATNQNVIWSSSDEDVAIVSEDGVVTAIMEGEAIITVTTEDGEFTADCTIFTYWTGSYIVSNSTQWEKIINFISNDEDNTDYTIKIVKDFMTTGTKKNTFGERKNITVTILGNHNIMLHPNSIGSLLWIGDEQTIIVRDVGFVGRHPFSNDEALIKINHSSATFNMEGIASVSLNRAMIHKYLSGVYNLGTFNMLDNSSIMNNDAGGVRNLGTFSMYDNSSISNNKTNTGGGVYSEKGSIFMFDNASISQNIGGGVYLKSGFVEECNMTISNNASISKNTSYYSGGGVFVGFYAELTMTDNSVISENDAYDSGGGVHVDRDGVFTMSGYASITRNCISPVSYPAIRSGGGVSNFGNTVICDNASIIGNGATNFGGGIYNEYRMLLKDNVLISGNYSQAGGGISSHYYGVVVLEDNVVISANTAGGGAGVRTSQGSKLLMRGGIIYGSHESGVPTDKANISSYLGAALYCEHGSVYGTGEKILPHIDGFEHYTDYTIIGRE